MVGLLGVREMTPITKSKAVINYIIGYGTRFYNRVNEFLGLLERIVEGNNLDATRIYNFDETGLTTVQ